MARKLFESESKERSKFDFICATKLLLIISKSKKVRIARTPKNWSIHFRLLRERDGISKGRIKAALKWYENNIEGEYTPFCASAKSFRAKFSSIERAMARAESSPSPQKLEITPAAHLIVERTGGLQYPSPEDKPAELRVIQASLNNFDDLRRKCKALWLSTKQEAQDKDKEKNKRTKQNLIYGSHWRDHTLISLVFMRLFRGDTEIGFFIGHTPESFVQDWMIEVWKMLWAIHEKGRASKLERHAFHLDSKRFQEQILKSVFQECFGDKWEERHQRFMEMIKNAD